MRSFDVMGVAIVEEMATKARFECPAERLMWSAIDDSEEVATVHTGAVGFGDDGEELLLVIEESLDGGIRTPRYEVSPGYTVVEEFEIELIEDDESDFEPEM